MKINGNGLKFLEIDMGIGGLEFGSGGIRFPGLVSKSVVPQKSKTKKEI